MRYIITILLCLIFFQSNSQRLKYKDLFPVIWGSDEERALMMIKEYLAIDPEHPNANYLLAGIYSYRYLTSDFLTQQEKAIANADQARLRITKCRVLLDEKEIRRNGEWYLSDDNMPLDWFEIDSTLTFTYNSSVEFIDKAPPIYEAFTKSVLHYDQTIKIYASICGEFTSLDNLLMLYNDELENNLKELKTSYDSTLFYFNHYKELIKDYPIGYDQNLTIIPIERFRLQGLVARIDFLNPEISIWDYGKWSDEVIKTVNDEVLTLRTRLKKNDDIVDEALTGNYNIDSEFESKVDKELVFNLEKLDFQSLPISILNYKDFLTDLKINESNRRYYDTATNLEVSSKYIYYSEILNKVRRADTLLNVIVDRNIDIKRQKHEEFLQSEYGGESGLETFIQVQQGSNEKRFDDYVLGLRNVIVDNSQETASTDSGKFISYKKKRYPLWVTGAPDSLAPGTLYTTHQGLNPDNSRYVGGYYLKTTGAKNVVSFICRINRNKVEWLKEFDISIDSVESDANNRLGAMELTKEGIVILVNSKHIASDMSMNTMYYLDDKGSVKFAKALDDISEYPRKIRFFEEQNRFILVFRGSSAFSTNQPATSRILAYNTIGDRLWSTSKSYTGTFVDLIGIKDSYLYVGNYSRYELQSGQSYTVSGTSAVTLKIGNRGDILIERPVDAEGYYITHVVKASDSNINLLGYKGQLEQYDNSGLHYGRNLVHLVMDSYSNLIASSID